MSEKSRRQTLAEVLDELDAEFGPPSRASIEVASRALGGLTAP